MNDLTLIMLGTSQRLCSLSNDRVYRSDTALLLLLCRTLRASILLFARFRLTLVGLLPLTLLVDGISDLCVLYHIGLEMLARHVGIRQHQTSHNDK